MSEISRVLRPNEGRCVLLTQTTQQLVACLDSEYFEAGKTEVRWANIGGLLCAFVCATRSAKEYSPAIFEKQQKAKRASASAIDDSEGFDSDAVVGMKRSASELDQS